MGLGRRWMIRVGPPGGASRLLIRGVRLVSLSPSWLCGVVVDVADLGV